MKINNRDKQLTKKEYTAIIDKMHTDTFLTIDKDHYQCADCHEVFSRINSECPVCKNKGSKRITRGKTRYDLRTAVQTFRKVGNHVIELVFLFTDYMNKEERKLKRDIILIRKSEYRDRVIVYLNNRLSYNPQLGTFNLWDYYGNYIDGYSKRDGWSEDKPSNVRASTLGIQSISINKHVLLQHQVLNRVYSNAEWDEFQWISNQHLHLAFKYPYILEMLYKFSRRNNRYYALASINRYPKAYKKYHKYFEKYGSFNPKLLAKLNKVEGMLKYNIFERLMSFNDIPKEIRTKRDLELYSGLARKQYSSYYFDERSYKDYLRIASERGLELTDEVKFNKNWKYDHDQWVKEIEIEKELAKEEDFVKVMSKYQSKKVRIQKKEILIEVPHSIKDLFHESDKLHHCVKSYSDDVIKGKCLVVFVRINPGEPFITAEIKGEKIVQMRGKGNSTNMILPEHRKAVNRFIKQELRPMEAVLS